MNTTMEKMITNTLSCYQGAYKCPTTAARPRSSALGRSVSDNKVADEMVQNGTLSLHWLDSGDLSRAITYGVLAALNRYLESNHLRLLVLIFTHLVGHFVVVLVGPPRSG